MGRTSSVQPDGTAGKDTYLANGGYATANYGNNTLLPCGTLYAIGVDTYLRPVISMPITTWTNQVVQEATLTLYSDGSGTTTGTPSFTCKRLTRTDWVESQATWNIYKTGSNWTTAGGDSTTTNSDTMSGLGTDTSYEFDALADMLQDAIDAGLTTLDMLLVGPEVSGYSNFINILSSETSTAAERPMLTVSVYPIVEQIARRIESRLAGVTTAAGYNQTLDVERPKRKGVQNAEGFRAFVTQAPEAEMVEVLQGNPGTITWKQEFSITIEIKPSDDDDTPFDTVANLAAADAEYAIAHDSLTSYDWSQFGGLALYAEQTGRDLNSSGPDSSVTLTYTVTYRTPENDPYTAR